MLLSPFKSVITLFLFEKEKSSAPKKGFVQALDISSKQPPEEDEEPPKLTMSAKNEIERLLMGTAAKTPEKVKIKKVKVVTPRPEVIVTKTQEEEDLDKFEKESKSNSRSHSSFVEIGFS